MRGKRASIKIRELFELAEGSSMLVHICARRGKYLAVIEVQNIEFNASRARTSPETF